MDALDSAPGFYGKVTSLGDFVTRRLPDNFVQGWDEWLQYGIAASREQMQRTWLETYLTSPIWRFALAPGIFGEVAWAGVLMPSVDRVGRHFPLTLAGGVAGECRIYEWLNNAKSWYENLEDLALSSLDEGFQLERMEQALQATPGIQQMLVIGRPAGSLREGRDAAVAYSWQDFSQMEAALPSLFPEIAHMALQGHSFWWTEGSQQVLPSLLVCRGLPSAAQYCAMLDGRWIERGWQWR